MCLLHSYQALLFLLCYLLFSIQFSLLSPTNGCQLLSLITQVSQWIFNISRPFHLPAKWVGVWACKRSPVWFPVASLWASCIDRRRCTTRNDAPFCTWRTSGKRWKRRRRTYRHRSHRSSISPPSARLPFECSSQSRRRPPSGFMRRFSFWWVQTRTVCVVCSVFRRGMKLSMANHLLFPRSTADSHWLLITFNQWRWWD